MPAPVELRRDEQLLARHDPVVVQPPAEDGVDGLDHVEQPDEAEHGHLADPAGLENVAGIKRRGDAEFRTFTEVYGIDVTYRGVADKLRELQQQEAVTGDG